MPPWIYAGRTKNTAWLLIPVKRRGRYVWPWNDSVEITFPFLKKAFWRKRCLFQRADCSWRRERRWLYLPKRVCLLREELEVLLSQLHRGQRLQLQVCGALDKAGEVGKGVQTQAVVAVVGQVGHEDADLGGKRSLSGMAQQNSSIFPQCCLVCPE